jgi:glycosyltransferase involved in cell wall biosynthesis
MQFGPSIFDLDKKSKIQIPDDAQVVFVADMFVEDYTGGAELTTEALISSSPFSIYKLHSKDLTMELLQQGQSKYWIFGNFSNMDLNLIPTVVRNVKYSIVEYDYKYCKHRSPEKHAKIENKVCDCHDDLHGKVVSAFYYGAQSLFWMSEKQQGRYFELFPFLEEKPGTVLSSVFDNKWFITMKMLREKYKDTEKKGYIYLASPSWVKGSENAQAWIEKSKTSNDDIEAEGVWGLPYEQVLEKLAQAKGFICLPNGSDTCPRMVIEARVLGCELVLNDFVLHKDEEWFNPVVDDHKMGCEDEITQIEQYLFAARQWFWNGIKHDMEYVPTISGYTTTRDCISQNYPYESTVSSLLSFCDEVVVYEGGSKDGTWERLESLAADEPRLKVYREVMDWDHPRFAVFDGLLKAKARGKCTKDFCWQMDSDEVVHEDDKEKILKLVTSFPHEFDLIALPVIEYWGGEEKVRMDVNPWKWRLSRNKSHITHGIPVTHRLWDDNGYLYAAQGTDGCDYIDVNTGDTINFGSFYTPEVALAKHQGMESEEMRDQYEKWFNHVIDLYPSVFHFSWWDMERKIKTYRDYWGKHWKSLFDIEVVDTAENNYMFNMPWSEVTDEMISARAKEFTSQMGGWIWHEKWDGTATPHINSNRNLPSFIKPWI